MNTTEIETIRIASIIDKDSDSILMALAQKHEKEKTELVACILMAAITKLNFTIADGDRDNVIGLGQNFCNLLMDTARNEKLYEEGAVWPATS